MPGIENLPRYVKWKKTKTKNISTSGGGGRGEGEGIGSQGMMKEASHTFVSLVFLNLSKYTVISSI